MKQVRYKYPAINVPSLLLDGMVAWGAFLKKCDEQNDVERLKAAYYGLQRGMADMAKAHLNGEKENLAFVNLQRSIEVVLKRILRRKYPSPLDNQGFVKNLKEVDSVADARKALDAKRKRDLEFTQFLKDARF